MPDLSQVTRSDVLEAIVAVRQAGVPAGRGATKFCLVIDNDHLPPKYTLALAARRHIGRPLRPDEFSGGTQTNSVLTDLGFEVRACSCGGASSRPSPRTAATSRSSRPATQGLDDIVRVVTVGQTPIDAHSVVRRLLWDAIGPKWPGDLRAKFLLTPGGFVRASWPRDLRVSTGWESKKGDLPALTRRAEGILDAIVSDAVRSSAARRTDFLTIGIDLLDGPGGKHAELVAVYDVQRRSPIRWTGKSYPTTSQQDSLAQVVDLDTHLLEAKGERVLVLGCHDLNMFNPRGRANQSLGGIRRERCDDMRSRVAKFKPTMVLQHPHSTDTPNIWRLGWGSLVKDNPSIKSWASGIAYFKWNGAAPRAPLARVRDETKSGGVVDCVLRVKDYT